MLDFSAKADEDKSNLFPHGQLAWVILNYREEKEGRETGTKYHDFELTVDDGQKFARRKIWRNIMDAAHVMNSDGAKNMGQVDCRRILEVAFGATPDNAQSYMQINSLRDFSGRRVPVKITRKKAAKDSRYDDSNEVEFLSPYSADKKVTTAYDMLVNQGLDNTGELDPTAAPALAGARLQPQAPAGQAFGSNPPAGNPNIGSSHAVGAPINQPPATHGPNTTYAGNPPAQPLPPASQQWLAGQPPQSQQMQPQQPQAGDVFDPRGMQA